MFYFILVGILLLATLAAVAFGFIKDRKGYRVGPPPLFSAGIGAILIALLTAFNSFTMVDHREVAVVTAFGKYDGTIATGGAHWIKPWANVEKFDQTIQTAEVTDVSVSFSDGGDDDGLQEIGGGKGLIDATVRWQISKDQENNGAKALWEKYRTFDAVSNSLVTRSARDAVISVSNSYPAATAIISQNDIASTVKQDLTEQLAPYGIVVDSVSVPAIDLDAGTQAAVDKLFTTQQDIKRAQNEQKRAEIDAETVRIRTQEGALSPEANQRYCLDVLNNWDVAKNGPLPATMNCAIGEGQTPVIVNAP